MRKYVLCSVAAVLAVATTPGAVKTSSAAAFPVDTYTAKSAASDVVEVRHGGGAFVAGIGLGLLGAAIIGNSYYYGPGYPAYYPGYYYPPYPYYGPYDPVYPRYRYYRHHRHW